MQLGNGKWESTTFNSRLQPTQIALGTVQNGTDKLKLNFEYNTAGQNDNNSNVLKQTITVPDTINATGFEAIQTYNYDELNRLKSAEEKIANVTSWKQTFTFDRYGNKRFDENNTDTLQGGCATAVCNPTIDPATNKLIGYTFDNSGNTKTDANGQTFTYDGENKQIKVVSGSTTVGEYFYDGDGKRIKKIAGSEETIFIYNASGQLVAEYSTQISQTPKVSYLTADHLGSPRIITDMDGDVYTRRDFMPFGEEIDSTHTSQRTATLNYATDEIKQKFTTYERDNETELDFAQARMHNYNLGRFTTIDRIIMAKERLRTPQRLNLYIYTINNPSKYTDPTGEDVAVNGSDSDITLYENDLNKKLEKSKLEVKVEKGLLTIVGKVPENLKGDALKIVNAINSKKTANISLVRNDGQVDFGSAYSLDKGGNLSTSNQRIDYAELEILNSAKIDGYDSSDVAFHETLEAIGIQIDGKSKEKAHDEIGGGLTPAVGDSTVTGVFKDNNGAIHGFRNKVRIEGTQTTFTYFTKFSTPFTPTPGKKGPEGEKETQKFRATSPLNIVQVQK